MNQSKSYFRIITLTIFLSIVLFVGCSENSTVAEEVNNDNLDWNKQIAVAYVHSYAIAIGEAMIEMENDSVIIN